MRALPNGAGHGERTTLAVTIQERRYGKCLLNFALAVNVLVVRCYLKFAAPVSSIEFLVFFVYSEVFYVTHFSVCSSH